MSPPTHPTLGVLQALEKAARTRGYLPASIVSQALARFRLVIDGKMSYDDYKSWLTPILTSAGLKREDGTFAWFSYLDDHWRSSKWWSLVSSRFRSLLARFGVDTNNTLEGTWETIKNTWGAHFTCRTITSLLKSLVGLPGDAASQAQSWFAKRCTHFDDVLRGRQRVGGGYKRDRVLLRLRRLIQLIESAPSEYVRDVDGVDPNLSEVWVGADTAGYKFSPPPAQGQDGALLLAKSVRLYSRYELMHIFKFKSVNEVCERQLNCAFELCFFRVHFYTFACSAPSTTVGLFLAVAASTTLQEFYVLCLSLLPLLPLHRMSSTARRQSRLREDHPKNC